MVVYTVWERPEDDWSTDYLYCIFQHKEDAEKYCEQKNKEVAEIELGNVSFYIKECQVF